MLRADKTAKKNRQRIRRLKALRSAQAKAKAVK